MINYELQDGKIIKKNCDNEYEPQEFVKLLKEQEKKLTEMVAQKKIYDAKAENVAHFHPHVLKLDEDKRNEIWLYQENHIASEQADKMIEAFEKNIADIKEEMEEITKQTGCKFYPEEEEEVKKEE